MGVMSLIWYWSIFLQTVIMFFKGKGMRLGLGQKKKIMFMAYNSAYYEPIAVEQVEDGADAEPDHVRIDENRLLNTDW